jgi:hypothetical protein
MKEFAHKSIAKFLGCECVTSEYSSPIHPRSLTYAFKAVSPQGTLALTVNPAQGICFVGQVDASNNEVATATVYVTELEVREDLNEETGEDEEFIVGVGPGGHICISKVGASFTSTVCTEIALAIARGQPSDQPAAWCQARKSQCRSLRQFWLRSTVSRTSNVRSRSTSTCPRGCGLSKVRILMCAVQPASHSFSYVRKMGSFCRSRMGSGRHEMAANPSIERTASSCA